MLVLALALAPAAPAAASAPMSYDAPPGGSALTLTRSGADLRLVDDNSGLELAAQPVADTSRVDVRGADAGDDMFTVDLDGGSFSVPVRFDGGAGGYDVIAVRGGHATT